MWRNKASRLEETLQDAPRAGVGQAGSVAEMHPSEGDNAGSGATPARPAVTTESVASRLGAGLRIQGDVTGTGDLIVEGTVDGTIQLEGHKLTIGTSAKVVADIQAGEIVVYGNIKGNLHARDRIEIKKDGAVQAELTTSRIMIEDGAYFKGSIEIERQVTAAGQRTGPQPGEAGSRAVRESEAKVVPIPVGGIPTLHPTSFARPESEKNSR